MTVKKILKELESLSNPPTIKSNTNRGATTKQFGVKSGDLRKIAKRIKKDHALALELWETEIIDARLLAILIIDPAALSKKELNDMVCSAHFVGVSDWFSSYVIKYHPDKEKMRLKWMKSKTPMAARTGWSVTASMINKGEESLDLRDILDTLEAKMGKAHPDVQWTMNFALGYTGIKYPKFRKRAVKIGKKIGLYSDYKVPKGCISPFVPVWVDEMVSREK